MRLQLPELQIESETGFDPELDIFDRKGFGERLANLICNADGGPVLALDSEWGEGKSTFINMWRGYLSHHRESKVQTIYFDAFENDYQKEPFLTLASEIYSLISPEDKEKQKEFRKKAANVAKSLTRGALKVAVRTVSAGLVDGSVVDSAEEGISDLIAEQVDDIVKEKFQNAEQDKLALKVFREALQNFATEIGGGNPIIFIVDELDRCRPDYALELLEQIKHLFSVTGITFLLVTNRNQLEESIRSKYGRGIDPTNYLHKFIGIWLSLPRLAEQQDDHGLKFLDHTITSMTEKEEKVINQESIRALSNIVRFYQPSFREIERMMSYFAVIHNMSGDTHYLTNYQYLLAMICYLKACRPGALVHTSGKLTSEYVIKQAGLAELVDDTEFYTLFYIKKLIQFDLGDDELRNQMISDKEIQTDGFGRITSSMIVTIRKWLSEIAAR